MACLQFGPCKISEPLSKLWSGFLLAVLLAIPVSLFGCEQSDDSGDPLNPNPSTPAPPTPVPGEFVASALMSPFDRNFPTCTWNDAGMVALIVDQNQKQWCFTVNALGENECNRRYVDMQVDWWGTAGTARKCKWISGTCKLDPDDQTCVKTRPPPPTPPPPTPMPPPEACQWSTVGKVALIVAANQQQWCSTANALGEDECNRRYVEMQVNWFGTEGTAQKCKWIGGKCKLDPDDKPCEKQTPLATPAPTVSSPGDGTCTSLKAHEIPAKVAVTEISLEYPIWSACYTAAEAPPCNGIYYAGSDQHEYHAVLYNADSNDGYAMVVLEVFDGNNVRQIVRTYTTMETKYKGHMQIRGLDFTPDGQNLVAYFGGGRGLNGQDEQFAARPGQAPFGAKSIVVNLEVPSFTEKWKKQIFSQTNVMELSVAGATQNLALSNDDFLIYTTGMGPVGPEGYKWMSGGCCHQWGYAWSVSAASGEQSRNIDASGPTFSSHSLIHGAAYSKSSKATLSFHTRDSKSAFILSVMKGGRKTASKSHNVWGGGYTSGATPGYVAASTSGDFGVVMSFGCTSEVGDKGHMDWTGYKGCAIEGQNSFVPLHQKDKAFFMKVNDKAEIQGSPKQIFIDDETQIAPALQPLPDGRWLMAYTTSNKPLWRSTKDYSSAHSGAFYQHMWSPELKNSMKSKLAVLDSEGNLEGSVESPGKFPVELHPLKPRGAYGFGWAYVEKGSKTVQISRLAC